MFGKGEFGLAPLRALPPGCFRPRRGSAWGPDPDRHRKSLVLLVFGGSQGGAGAKGDAVNGGLRRIPAAPDAPFANGSILDVQISTRQSAQPPVHDNSSEASMNFIVRTPSATLGMSSTGISGGLPSRRATIAAAASAYRTANAS